MANAFQRSAFQDNAFQGGTGTTPVIPPRFGAGQAGRKRKRQRVIVEIDDVEYVVRSIDEARVLLAQAREQVIATAERAAKTALNKARDVERKTGKFPVLEVAIPEIEVKSGYDEEYAALFKEWQAGVDEAFLRAAQSAELALLVQREYLRQDEEDVVTVLLLS